MSKATRIFLLLAIFTGQMYISFADRGIPKKKTKVTMNIRPAASFNNALNFNLKSGLRYTGSLIAPSTTSNSFNTLVTYTKGKSVYILPYKQKVLVADVRQGYTGTKLIIRPR